MNYQIGEERIGNAEIFHVLASMGHGDSLVICDALGLKSAETVSLDLTGKSVLSSSIDFRTVRLMTNSSSEEIGMDTSAIYSTLLGNGIPEYQARTQSKSLREGLGKDQYHGDGIKSTGTPMRTTCAFVSLVHLRLNQYNLKLGAG